MEGLKGLLLKLHISKVEEVKTRPTTSVEDILKPYLSDEPRLHRVFRILKSAQQAVEESGLNRAITITGSSVTGKEEADIDVFLDVSNLYAKDVKSGNYLYINQYENFLRFFK